MDDREARNTHSESPAEQVWCAKLRIVRLRLVKALKGLVIVAGLCPVAKDLTDIAVRPLFVLVAVVGGVWGGVGHLHLGGTVLGVMEVEAVTDVTEQPWQGFLLLWLLFVATDRKESTLFVWGWIRFNKMVNGLCLLSIFLPSLKPKALYHHSPIHLHTLRAVPLPYTVDNPNHQKHCGVQCLAQRHFDAWVGKAGLNLWSSDQKSTIVPLHHSHSRDGKKRKGWLTAVECIQFFGKYLLKFLKKRVEFDPKDEVHKNGKWQQSVNSVRG